MTNTIRACQARDTNTCYRHAPVYNTHTAAELTTKIESLGGIVSKDTGRVFVSQASPHYEELTQATNLLYATPEGKQLSQNETLEERVYWNRVRSTTKELETIQDDSRKRVSRIIKQNKKQNFANKDERKKDLSMKLDIELKALARDSEGREFFSRTTSEAIASRSIGRTIQTEFLAYKEKLLKDY